MVLESLGVCLVVVMVYDAQEFKWGCVKVKVEVRVRMSQGKGRLRVDELRGIDFSFHHHNFASLGGNKARGYEMGGKSVVSM